MNEIKKIKIPICKMSATLFVLTHLGLVTYMLVNEIMFLFS